MKFSFPSHARWFPQPKSILLAMILLTGIATGLQTASSIRYQAALVETTDARALMDSGGKSQQELSLPIDYTATLPRMAAMEPFLQELHHAASGVGVGIDSLSAEHAIATRTTLGHIQLGMNIRGAYAPIKSILSTLLDRHPNLLLQRLALQRNPSASDLDARVDLVLLSRPLSSGASD